MTNQVNYLLKDELVYELYLRDITLDKNTCVELLRKRLRESWLVPSDVKHLTGKLQIEEEIKVINSKIALIGAAIDSPDINSPLYIARTRSKLSHLTKRIQMLGYVKNPSEELSDKIKGLSITIEDLNKNFTALVSPVPKEDLALFEEDLNQSFIEDENTMDQMLKLEFRTPKTNKQNYSTIEETQTETSNLNHLNTEHLNQTLTEPIQNKFEAHTLTQQAENNSTILFNKLPNPLEKYLAQIPTTDGLNISDLLLFLRNLVKIRQETTLNIQDLYQLLPSYCQGPLLSKVLSARKNNLNLDQLHTDILATFVPVTLKVKLTQDYVYRPQLVHEPLSGYISEVKLHAEILKTGLSESDIVSFIKLGIHPDVRNKLVFENNPTTYQDLDLLCIKCNNVIYHDYLRDSYFNSNLNSNLISGTQSFDSRLNNKHTFQARSHARPQDIKTCHICKNPGHFARHCSHKQKN